DNDDVDVIMIHIDEVFQGQVDSLCVIDGIFQISDDPLALEEDDEFDELTITGLGSTIVLTNDDNELDMPDDDTLALTDSIGIRASEDTDRWYIYTEATIAGEEEEAVEEEEEEVVEEEEEAGEEEAGEEEAGEEEAGEGEAGEEEAAEEEPAEEEPAEEEPAGTPGFEAVFAIAGLLAIAYLVRRN
ncbi:MAG: S-layer protein domain-containing protein, partial [Euryarchaeota archaeon]|nr:S-layer protein domain-containing protein [Euryarchaeota archaeon]